MQKVTPAGLIGSVSPAHIGVSGESTALISIFVWVMFDVTVSWFRAATSAPVASRFPHVRSATIQRSQGRRYMPYGINLYFRDDRERFLSSLSDFCHYLFTTNR
jgi:hypothetical protein